MPRRYRPEKREVEPDLRYDNLHVAMFINRLMRGGKKSTAARVMYDSMDLIDRAWQYTRRWRSLSRRWRM